MVLYPMRQSRRLLYVFSRCFSVFISIHSICVAMPSINGKCIANSVMQILIYTFIYMCIYIYATLFCIIDKRGSILFHVLTIYPRYNNIIYTSGIIRMSAVPPSHPRFIFFFFVSSELSINLSM